MVMNGSYCSMKIDELGEYDFEKMEKKLYGANQT